MTTVDEAAITAAAEVVRLEMAARSGRRDSGLPGQPMISEALLLIASQALLPILVSVTSTRLSDVLKERRLRRMSRRESEAAAQEFVGRTATAKAELDDESRAELRRLLGPQGFSDEDLDRLADRVLERISAR